MTQFFTRPWEGQPPSGSANPSQWAIDRRISHFSLANHVVDLAVGRLTPPTITTGSQSSVSGKFGVALDVSGANSRNQSRQVFGNTGWTAVIGARPQANAGITGASWVQQEGGGGSYIRIGQNFDRNLSPGATNSLSVAILESGVSRNGAYAASACDGLDHVFVIRHSYGSAPRMWRDGVELTVTNPNGDGFSANPTAASDTFRTLGNSGDGGQSPACPVYLTAVLGSEVTAAECQALSVYESMCGLIFEPRRVYIPTAAGGGGAPAESGGASSSVTVSAAGAGNATEQASGGASASVSASAAGAGTALEQAGGGAGASVSVTAAGAGTASSAASGGASAVVSVSAAGAGSATEAASGGASAAVSVTAAGAGTSADGASGGSTATVSVSAAGAGTATEAATGGASAVVLVTAAGVGLALEIAAGGSSASVSVSAAGGGTDGAVVAGTEYVRLYSRITPAVAAPSLICPTVALPSPLAMLQGLRSNIDLESP